MPLQKYNPQNLSMIGLGSVDDRLSSPVESAFPLRDGIHLRWSFSRDQGFPWYGYHLFRRLHYPKAYHCLSEAFQELNIGTLSSFSLRTPDGLIVSNQDLVLVDEFLPLGTVELDLANRKFLRFEFPSLQPVNRVKVLIGFRKETEITVRALSGRGKLAIAVKNVAGAIGDIVEAEFTFDLITALEFSGGDAVVIDICSVPVGRGILTGWDWIDNFPYPLCLPVAHDDYKCPTKPGDKDEARRMAFDRIRYGRSEDWQHISFRELHQLLVMLVEGGPPPNGWSMAQREFHVSGTPKTSGGATNPTMTQRPLDLIVAACINPAIAQMVGLYWVDEIVEPDDAYDYLIVADHTGVFGEQQAGREKPLFTDPNFPQVDAWLVSNIRKEPAPMLDPPSDLRAYALPGSTRISDEGELQKDRNSVGLRWELGQDQETGPQPLRPVLYHLWRTDLETEEEPKEEDRPEDSKYWLITEAQPILVVDLPPGKSPEFPADWPPFRLHAIDSSLREGWYSYRVSGIDIFGRHSPRSEPGAWFQWEPEPSPRPWYYRDSPGDTELHPYAVGILDKIAPPPPSAIEAYALDPQDPLLVRDDSYHDWQGTLTQAERESLVGLRVRWQWTHNLMQQAPDVKEFRIYFQSGQWDIQTGRINTVSAVSSTESLVHTNIAHTKPANAYQDYHLRVGENMFRVVGSDVGSPLRVRVENIGPAKNIRPSTNVAFKLSLNYTSSVNWQQRYHVVDFTKGVQVTKDADGNELPPKMQFTQFEVFLPATGGSSVLPQPPLEEPVTYAQIGVSAADSKQHTDDDSKWGTPPNVSIWGNRPGNEGSVGGPITIYRVRRERPEPPEPPPDAERVLATPANYDGESYYTYRWQHRSYLNIHIYRALDDAVFKLDWLIRTTRTALDPSNPRHRKIFPDSLSTSRKHSVATELNAIDALGDYATLSQDARTVLKLLPGNEGKEWNKGLQEYDWEIRQTRTSLHESDAAYFPPDWNEADINAENPVNQLKRQAVVDKLNGIVGLLSGSTGTLADDIVTLDGIPNLSPVRPYRDTIWLANDTANTPQRDRFYRIIAVDEATYTVTLEADENRTLSGPNSPWIIYLNEYQSLTEDPRANDAMRVLAGLPGNEKAFTQITIKPLDPNDPAHANRPGPDNPDDPHEFPIDAGLRIYIDTLDGRSTNRYFYRSAFVDKAHNRSTNLSLSSPPVYLPNVVPPRTPVITKVLGGDRQITLRWASNRESDLVEYRIYRTDQKEKVRDIRLMGDPVHVEPVTSGDPAARPAEVDLTDDTVGARQEYYYLITAVDTEGNVSKPSAIVVGRAYQSTPDAPTSFSGTYAVHNGRSEAILQWIHPEPDEVYFKVEQQKQLVNALGQPTRTRWYAVTDWLGPNVDSITLEVENADDVRTYRIRTRDSLGQSAEHSPTTIVAPV